MTEPRLIHANPVFMITGGRGTIGSAIARLALATDHGGVYLLDDLSAGAHNEMTGCEFVHCDVANAEKLFKVVGSIRPDVVIHLAAHFANQNSVDFPVSDATTNIVGTINLLETLRRIGGRSKVVYASSSCVYGNSPEMQEDSNLQHFDTPYAISKYTAELYHRFYAAHHKISAVSVRIFNTYGPGEMPGRYRNVIPNFISKALRDEPIVITGSGEETRDFTYVDDTASLLLTAAFSRYCDGEVFNGGTGIETSISNLAELIIRLSGSKSNVEFVARRNWDAVDRRFSDTTRTAGMLGFHPRTDLVSGLIKTIEWLRARM